MKSVRYRIAAVAGVVLAAACAAPPAPDAPPRPTTPAAVAGAEPPPGTEPLHGSEWVLVSLRGARPLPRPPVTLSFQEDAFGAYGGCNWLGGGYSTAGDTVRLEEVSMTLRGCLDPDVSGQEDRFLRALHDVRRFRLGTDTLRLYGGAGEVVLELRRKRLAAMDPARLPGTRWRLVSSGDRSPVPGSRVTLTFSNDSIRGHAGCRGYTGTYHARSHRLRVTSISMDETECRDERLAAQEGDFTTALSETTDFQVDGGVLELHTVSGAVLRFERERGRRPEDAPGRPADPSAA